MFYFALLFIVAGLWLVVAFFLEALRSRRYRSFPQADGFVTKLDLRERKGRNKTWNPNIEFTYQVNEKTYTGSRLTFSRVVVDGTTEGKIRQLFAEGNPVKVYYNPRKPGDSVLNPGGADLKIRFTVGIMLLLVGLGIILVQLAPK
jgi:Protein of unknown function (DUF3592)